MFLIVNYVNKANTNATTTGTSTLANIYNTDGTVNGKATYEVLKAIGYYGHENDTGTYTAHNIAGRTSDGSGSTVIFPMGYYVSKSGTMDTTKPIYWQAVYLRNGYLTIWMNNNYTYDFYNSGASTTSGWGNGTSYSSYSNYSQSTLRDITNNIYTALSGKLVNLSSFVQSPSEAGTTWQKTENEDVYTVSASIYDHHNNLYYSGTSSYGGGYTAWSHSLWNNTNQPYSDKFWIPSSAEVFNNGSGQSVENGLWGLNANDRCFKSINNNYYTIEGNNSTYTCWLRSGYSQYSNAVMAVNSSDSAGAAYFDFISYNSGVRPACHLSLLEMANSVSFSVTLDQQGGSGGTSSVTAIYGEAIPSITVPTRAGYTFGGYYTGTNGTETQYYTASGGGTQNWNILGDTTLYAYWIKKYNIYFNLNNTDFGSILNDGGSFTSGSAYTSYAISKPNCAFIYWIDSSAPTVPIYENPLTITVTSDKTYTAYFTNSLMEGVSVTANFGGSAEILQTVDTTTLADTDTLTLIARLRYNGYQFDGWFIKGETMAFSTNMSVSVQYGAIKNKVIIAKFSKVNSNANTDTDNTNEFL